MSKPPKHDPRCYLEVQRLRPGDVILTQSFGKLPSAVAFATSGPFSHASILISRNLIFESDSIGVGPTFLPISRAERSSGGLRLLAEIEGAKSAIVLRHESFSGSGSDSELVDRLWKVLSPLMAKQYPSLKTLALTLQWSPAAKKFAEFVLDRLQSKRSTSPNNPGPFCSALVVLAFESMGYDCFNHKILPDEISPNALLNSNLVLVQDAIGQPNPEAQLIEGLPEDSSEIAELGGFGDRSTYLTEQVSLYSRAQSIREKTELFCKRMDEFMSQYGKDFRR